MSKLRKKLNYLQNDNIKKKWHDIESQDGLSTKAKLEKLVKASLKKEKRISNAKNKSTNQNESQISNGTPLSSSGTPGVIVQEFSYPLDSSYGKFSLAQWSTITPQQLTVMFGPEDCEDSDIDPMGLLFFDTETTGLSGGTGTIPFMLGFGYFNGDHFEVKIFILNDLSREEVFLSEVDQFLESRDFSAIVTYNGKSFDLPLVETRYILQRKRFSLSKLPHLDYLYPARVIWKNTYQSRRLGYLGEMLLGLSREDDIDGSQIPAIYFNYLRSKSFALIEKVVEHNSLDLVGLAALLLTGLKYQEDMIFTEDEGEILGIAKLSEKAGDFERARQLYDYLKEKGMRKEIIEKAIRGLAILKKREKLYLEASQLWELLVDLQNDHQAVRELSVHLEHREKNYSRALSYVRNCLSSDDLTDAQRLDFEKRLKRLTKKIAALEKED